MKKFFYSAAVALALLGADARAAHFQSGGVRVGPAADDAASDLAPSTKPKSGEEKAAPASAADSRAARHVAPKKEPSAGRAAEGGEGKRASEKTQGAAKAQEPAPLSNTTASAVPPSTGKPSATSDAPPRPGSDAGVPVGAPVKTASGALSAPESGKSAQPSPAGNAADTKAAPASTNASAPTANASAAVASAAASLANLYRIGTGDVLDIRLLSGQDPRQSTLYPVLAGGVLDYPLLRDPLTVAGMTTEELAAQLIAEFRHRGLYERPQVRVSVREYASHAVLISGLVNDPGTKILRREAIPLYVVIAESQPKPEAGRAVVISHSTGKVINVDLNDAAALNTLVQSGDVVTLTVRPPEFFYVGGEIGSPGQKDFHAGMTLTQALLASGGVTRTAGDRVRVARQGADGRLVSAEYNLRDVEGGVVPDPLIQAGDRIEVPARRK